jgi:hypothetical protein
VPLASPEAARTPNPYEVRKAARIDRMRSRAARLAAAAEGAHASARAIADRIPFGQPILVGHHSERCHRRDLGRMHASMGKFVELHDEAEALRRRAERAEKSRAVSSDDPEAIDKLRAKLEELERDRARMVAANKAVRSPRPREALAAVGLSERLIERILTPDPMGNVGFPGYALRNAAGEAAGVRKRIQELETRRSRPAPSPVVSEGARIEQAENRVRLFFDQKPVETIRSELKRSGFRWSPTVGAWQRHASPEAWYEAERIATKDGGVSPMRIGTPAPWQAKREARLGARKQNDDLRKLREQIRTIVDHRKLAIHEAALHCQAERKRLKEQAKALRREALERARHASKEERSAAREVCRARKAEVRSTGRGRTDQARAELRKETQFQRELRRAEGRMRKREAARTTAAERQQESDDEVRANIDPELVPLFNRVRRSIKSSPHQSRTEAFLGWLEENPDAVIEVQQQLADRELAKLLREQKALGPLIRARRRTLRPPSLADVPF